METQFANHIKNSFAFIKNRKVLIACSGGLDSVVLTRLLHQHCKAIGIAHCNFKLRDSESDGDESFVHKLAHQLSVPFFAKDFDTISYADNNQISIQMAARELRYNWFRALSEQYDYDYIATAHHLDDDLETFLINLSRGTGLEGLTGIPIINEQVIRPLLLFSKDEIKALATAKGWMWREDSSNQSNKYLRNKLRLEVIPKLKETTPSFLKNFGQTLQNLQNAENFIKNRAAELQHSLFDKQDNGVLKIKISAIEAEGNPKDILFYVLKDFGFTAWNDVFDLVTAQPGKQIVSDTHRLIKDRDFLLLDSFEKVHHTGGSSYLITEDEDLVMIQPGTLKFEVVSQIQDRNRSVAYFDKKKLKYPLLVRKWKEGDYFYPLGMKGKKKLSKYFKDEKLSVLDKEKIWLLCAGDDIIWVIGHRPDDRYKVTSNTTEIVKVTVNK
ncbi:tRNA lysidine(34) synthetase TilS [Aquimarina brevivitae]|uniref:tRNA(Ile)-lysidine synthase n=1 Tax=Aquimarina brevivitae TaxID=323412 RepID=A0A4Q7NZS0_9FLAO|nr:tRNA lysidine(34) synthetase TilS [Aquimarina brevivitae]RZS92560.1 tRNA(Ile)-lysidine synthase [Aquimarina brevivitae]